MTMTDPIADMLTRIRNAINVRSATVDVPYSNFKQEIAKILKDERFVSDYQILGESPKKMMRFDLKYTEESEPVITGITRESKPGRRLYMNCGDIRPVMKGMGIAIVSTSKGVVTDKKARELGVGGEIICKVW